MLLCFGITGVFLIVSVMFVLGYTLKQRCLAEKYWMPMRDSLFVGEAYCLTGKINLDSIAYKEEMEKLEAKTKLELEKEILKNQINTDALK